MLFLLAFITVIVTVSQAVSFRRMLRYVDHELRVKPGAYLPKVSLILPCKGLDPGFSVNVRKLLAQQYIDPATGKPKFEAIFAVGSDEDPAYAALLEECAKNKEVRTEVVVAGKNAHRAHKVNSQLAALDKVCDDAEVLVFVDSDVIARADFLRYLVAQLDNAQIGATTGYRFYIPFKGDWPSLIRSLWNRMTAWEMANPDYAFAWGGAIACRREVFERARVADSWQRSADDDLALTTAIKSLGLRIHFVPQCLVATHGDASFKEIIEWTNRQLILTKVYYPILWKRAILRAVVLTVWLVAVLSAVFCATLWRQNDMVLAMLVGFSLLPVELLFLFKAQGLWSHVLKANLQQHEIADVDAAHAHTFANRDELESLQRAYNQSLWRFSAVLPLAHLVLPWMTLYSIVTNRIQWRGITYELRSPTETVII